MAAFREYAKHNPGMSDGQYYVQRIGLFTNPTGLSPLPKKVKKSVVNQLPENSRYRGTQFITSGLKSKDATTAAYFDKVFKRIFIKEAIAKPKKKKPIPELVIIPASPGKKSSTPGDNYGCFATYTHFKMNKLKKMNKAAPQLPNCAVGPNAPLNPYPKAMDPRMKKKLLAELKKKPGSLLLYLNHKTADYFDPNPFYVEIPKSTYVQPKTKKVDIPAIWIPVGESKKDGGGKFGTFNPYPEYMSPRLKKAKKWKPSKESYSPYLYDYKSYYTPCISHKVVDMSCNATNYLDYQPSHVARYAPPPGE